MNWKGIGKDRFRKKNNFFLNACPGQIFIGHGWRRDGVVGVDDGYDVEADELGYSARQMASGVVVIEIGFGDQNLRNVATNWNWFKLIRLVHTGASSDLSDFDTVLRKHGLVEGHEP